MIVSSRLRSVNHDLKQRDSKLKLGLISSAWLGTSIDTARGIELTKQIGFDTIDIFADPLEILAAGTPAHPEELRVR